MPTNPDKLDFNQEGGIDYQTLLAELTNALSATGAGGSGRNPVPTTAIPGLKTNPAKPTKSYARTADSIRAMTDLLPFYNEALYKQILPEEEARYNATEQMSPKYNQLSLDLLKQFGPQFAEANAGIDLGILQGTGQELVDEALALYRKADPEFFATRELTSNRLADLMGNIDLTGGLSGSERAEIERSLGQDALNRGSANAPSQLDTVSNAMRFGEAGRKRQLENQSELSKAVAAATAFLPASRTGIDPYQIATGKTSTAGFAGVTPAKNSASAAQGGSQIVDTNNQFKLAQMQINSQKKDWADYLNQVTSSIGNLIGSASK